MHAVTAWRARRGCDAGRSRPDTGPQPRYAHAVTAPPPKLVVRSPAKLNLALSVGAPGADRMHPISSWMVTTDFADELHLTRLDAGRDSLYAILWADDAPRRSDIDWPIQKDLAVRAHLALQEHAGRPLPVRMKLQKRIPVGGGLGGGSSNAAAMLRGINELHAVGLSRQELAQIAHSLGSDVPFLVRGGSAIVEGLGERLEHHDAVPDLHAVLVFPRAACPTGPVYGVFDRLRPDAALDPARVRALARTSPLRHDAPFNDLALPAIEVAPVLRDAIEQVAQATGRSVHVSGSGSTLFILCGGRTEAELYAEQIRNRTALPAIAVTVANPA